MYDCDVGYHLATGEHGIAYYNTLTACHTRTDNDATVGVGVHFEAQFSTRFGQESGANTNCFYGCKLGGSSKCVDVEAPISNLVFSGCSFELAEHGVVLLALGVVGKGERPLAVNCTFTGCRFEGGSDAFPGQLVVGEFAEDCSFFGCLISGGVEVTDDGYLNNWFPKQARSEHQIGFALLPGDFYSRIGSHNFEHDYFNSLQARTIRTLGPGAVFESRQAFGTSEAEFRIGPTGTLEWGPQGGPPDAALRREGPETLRVQSHLVADVVSSASFQTLGPDQVDPGIELDGETASVLALRFAVRDVEIVGGARAGDVMIIAPSGKLRPCQAARDPRVAGVLLRRNSPPPGARGDLVVAGVVDCRVGPDSRRIVPGDLLTTSRQRGRIMKPAEPGLIVEAGAVLGKALSRWQPGVETVRVLLTL